MDLDERNWQRPTKEGFSYNLNSNRLTNTYPKPSPTTCLPQNSKVLLLWKVAFHSTTVFIWGNQWLNWGLCCDLIETNQSTYFTNQLASFYMRRILALKRLKMPYNRPPFTVITYLFIYSFINLFIFHFVSCCNKPNKQYFSQ